MSKMIIREKGQASSGSDEPLPHDRMEVMDASYDDNALVCFSVYWDNLSQSARLNLRQAVELRDWLDNWIQEARK